MFRTGVKIEFSIYAKFIRGSSELIKGFPLNFWSKRIFAFFIVS